MLSINNIANYQSLHRQSIDSQSIKSQSIKNQSLPDTGSSVPTGRSSHRSSEQINLALTLSVGQNKVGNNTGPGFSIDQAPLNLAYQAAIDQINEAVAPYLGDNAIQRGEANGVDVSPQATANRIVSFATGLFGLYQQQQPQDSLTQQVDKFVAVITSGVEKGFAEAQQILSGLGVLEGELETNINLTFDLVMEGLDEFAAAAIQSED
ncbi:MAG: DUF5610 domain-containing protein [Pseudomonadales bacterium]|nr:DUF5610 domain-containing protein [Pseudomonadales bacterium]